MIVVDASAAVAALLNDGAARRALADERVHAPHLIDAEIVSALRRLTAAGAIGDDAAVSGLTVYRRLAVRRHPTLGLLDRVWELRDNLSAYDATYVALAEALDCPLLTADARLARAGIARCLVNVVPR